MSSILKLITPAEKKTLVGVVKSKKPDGTYVVDTGGRERTVRSSLSSVLVPGAKVLLSETSEETYIFGKDNMRRKAQVIIPVDG